MSGWDILKEGSFGVERRGQEPKDLPGSSQFSAALGRQINQNSHSISSLANQYCWATAASSIQHPASSESKKGRDSKVDQEMRRRDGELQEEMRSKEERGVRET